MEENIINENMQKFLDIYQKNISREGSRELLEWLKKTDFFVAPASTKFHSACAGGLCSHSILVYERFKSNLQREFGDELSKIISEESIAIIALLHDICKVDCYKIDYKNVKIDNEWVKQPYYMYNDSLPYGHGEKSVYMISGFMKLTREEALAINWHMGGFDSRVIGGFYGLSNVFANHPISLIMHVSDVEATYLDETIIAK